MSDLTLLHELPELLRVDFCAFVVRCFATLDSKQLEMGDYIEVIASRLADVQNGEIRRLIINVPPRHLKSLIASIAFPAWSLGQNPSTKIMCVSYGETLTSDFARQTRTIMQTDWYQRLFPETRLTSQRPALEDLTTTANGRRLAVSVGGAVTGRGADIIILDDPLKPDEAASDSHRQAVNDWYDGTLQSRLNDQRSGAIVLVMQRLHEDDLVGHVLQQEEWVHLRFPAIAEEDEAHPVVTPWGTKTFCRRNGEALHPRRQPLDILEQRKKNIGSYFFAAQYQQRPAPVEGGIIKPAWFPRYEPAELPDPFEQTVQSWDSANKVGEHNAYSVCTTWGLKRPHVYLLHVFRKKLEFPDLKKAVRIQQQIRSATVVLIEDMASGTPLIQELNRDGLSAVQGCKPTADKMTRMLGQTAMIEDGRVHLPAQAPWLDGYLEELASFPRSKHADQVDSTSQFLAWFNMPMKAWGMYEFTRREAEKHRHPEQFYVRLKAPPGIGSAQTFSGRHVAVDDDRTVAVSEEDARCLLAGGWTRVSTMPTPKTLQLQRPQAKPVYAIGSMEWRAEHE